MQLLRLFGMPSLTALATNTPGVSAKAGDSLKAKAAAKKHVYAELQRHVVAQDLPVFVLENPMDR